MCAVSVACGPATPAAAPPTLTPEAAETFVATPTSMPTVLPLDFTPTPTPMPTPVPTVTDVPATNTPPPTPEDQGAQPTATAALADSAWLRQVGEIHRINGALADAGRGYQAGTVSQASALATLALADHDAGAVAQSVGALAPPAGADAESAANAQRAATTWSSTLHALHRAADDGDFFSGVPLVSQLQTDARSLDVAIDRLHLTAVAASG